MRQDMLSWAMGIIPLGVEDPEDVSGRLGNSGWVSKWKLNQSGFWRRKHQMFVYLSDGLAALCCAGSWIPWRVLYKNPSKSLNESAPLYCSPTKTQLYLLSFLFTPAYPDLRGFSWFHWTSRPTASQSPPHLPLAPGSEAASIPAAPKQNLFTAFSDFKILGPTWKMRRSIWYFRTCTGAPSVTVWKVQMLVFGFKLSGILVSIWISFAVHLYCVLLQVDPNSPWPAFSSSPPQGGW